MDPQKVRAIQEWPAPVDKKGVQRCVGFDNFYRRFIKRVLISHFTHYSPDPLGQFQWPQEAQEAFNKLNSASAHTGTLYSASE